MSADRATLVALSHVWVAARDPLTCARFAEDIVGLQRSEETADPIALRADDRSRALVFSRGGESRLAVEAWDDAALDDIQSRLSEAGFPARRASADECRARRIQSGLLARDATGNAIEIVTRPERSGRRFFGARDAGLKGLSDVGLRSTDVIGDLRFWRSLGAEVSDYVGEIAYLAIDDAHHRIALYPSTSKGPLYLAFEVATLDDLMRANYFLAERQIKIVQGPGRQPASEQVFLHFQGPEGLNYTYVTGMAKRDHSRPPRQFPSVAESLCAWGSRADGAPELSPANQGAEP